MGSSHDTATPCDDADVEPPIANGLCHVWNSGARRSRVLTSSSTASPWTGCIASHTGPSSPCSAGQSEGREKLKALYSYLWHSHNNIFRSLCVELVSARTHSRERVSSRTEGGSNLLTRPPPLAPLPMHTVAPPQATSPRRRHTVLPAFLAALLQLLRLASPRGGGACQRGEISQSCSFADDSLPLSRSTIARRTKTDASPRHTAPRRRGH